MKIQLCTLPIPDRLHGWQRVARRAKNVFRGVLLVQVGQFTFKFAN